MPGKLPRVRAAGPYRLSGLPDALRTASKAPLCMESGGSGQSRDTGKAMSEENVEIVLRSWEAWNQGGAESAKRFWAENYELHDPPDVPDPRVVRGRDAVAPIEDPDQRSRRPKGDDRRCEERGMRQWWCASRQPPMGPKRRLTFP